jgi:hypothetical protein
MVTWAQNNNDDYPLPSRIDRANYVVGGVAAGAEVTKDNTRNIESMMIFNGSLSVEIMINPAEADGLIKTYDGYEFDSPSQAQTTSQATWDPKFRGTPLDGAPLPTGAQPNDAGNNSYAHNIPFGKRKAKWSNSFVSTEAVFGDRGPIYSLSGTGTSAVWNLVPNHDEGDRSITLLIHGSRTKWEGNIAFNDNHVDFLTKADPDNLTFTFTGLAAGARSVPDNIFMNENDQMRTVTNGGETATPQTNAGGLGSYQDTNAGANANAYLRPINVITGTNQTPTFKFWVD